MDVRNDCFVFGLWLVCLVVMWIAEYGGIENWMLRRGGCTMGWDGVDILETRFDLYKYEGLLNEIKY